VAEWAIVRRVKSPPHPLAHSPTHPLPTLPSSGNPSHWNFVYGVMRRRLQINARPDTQLPKPASHPTTRMRKLFKLCAVIVLVVLVVSISGVGDAAWDKLMFYGRVARLYTRNPDSKLSMPLQEVLKRQVANTWHAPRGTDRLH